MVHTVHKGLRALLAKFGISKVQQSEGGGGGGKSSLGDYEYFWGRDVGAVKHATSLARGVKQGCGQGCFQV